MREYNQNVDITFSPMSNEHYNTAGKLLQEAILHKNARTILANNPIIRNEICENLFHWR